MARVLRWNFPPMPYYDAVFFDFDGVLLDTEPVHCAAWAEVLAPFGVKLEWESYRKRFVGMEDRDVLRTLAAEHDPPLAFETLWETYPAKKEALRRIVGSAPSFLPEMGRFLEALHGEHKLAVVSSSARSEVETLLELGGLRKHFDAMVCGEDVRPHKPAPGPYLLAAKLLGVKRALVVEDSPVGIASGKAAGFDVVEAPSAAEMPAAVRARLASVAGVGRTC